MSKASLSKMFPLDHSVLIWSTMYNNCWVVEPPLRYAVCRSDITLFSMKCDSNSLCIIDSATLLKVGRKVNGLQDDFEDLKPVFHTLVNITNLLILYYIRKNSLWKHIVKYLVWRVKNCHITKKSHMIVIHHNKNDPLLQISSQETLMPLNHIFMDRVFLVHLYS